MHEDPQRMPGARWLAAIVIVLALLWAAWLIG